MLAATNISENTQFAKFAKCNRTPKFVDLQYMGLMICLGQGGLRSPRASGFLVKPIICHIYHFTPVITDANPFVDNGGGHTYFTLYNRI